MIPGILDSSEFRARAAGWPDLLCAFPEECDPRSIEFRASESQNCRAKSLRLTWIAINLLQSMTCEQFPPKSLILNNRDKRFFASLTRTQDVRDQLATGNWRLATGN